MIMFVDNRSAKNTKRFWFIVPDEESASETDTTLGWNKYSDLENDTRIPDDIKSDLLESCPYWTRYTDDEIDQIVLTTVCVLPKGSLTVNPDKSNELCKELTKKVHGEINTLLAEFGIDPMDLVASCYTKPDRFDIITVGVSDEHAT